MSGCGEWQLKLSRWCSQKAGHPSKFGTRMSQTRLNLHFPVQILFLVFMVSAVRSETRLLLTSNASSG